MNEKEALHHVQSKISDACRQSNRTESEVTLIAVSKTWNSSEVLPFYELQQTDFGENKLQELEDKAPKLPSEINWHFIGGLQRNKVRKVLKHSNVIHSVDSLKLAHAINRVAGEEQKTPEIFIQINIGEEETKGGFSKDSILEVVEEVSSLDHLRLIGLMCIPPAVADSEQARGAFAKMRELRDTIEGETGHQLPKLSMGMSNDYWIAIEEGATHVRVGSALFGQRVKPV